MRPSLSADFKPSALRGVKRFVKVWWPVVVAALGYMVGTVVIGQVFKHSGLSVPVGIPCQIVATIALFVVYIKVLNWLAVKRRAAK